MRPWTPGAAYPTTGQGPQATNYDAQNPSYSAYSSQYGSPTPSTTPATTAVNAPWRANAKPAPSAGGATNQNPSMRTFLRKVIAKNQSGSKEQQTFIRDALAKFARTCTADHDWDQENPDHFYHQALHQFNATMGGPTPDPVAQGAGYDTGYTTGHTGHSGYRTKSNAQGYFTQRGAEKGARAPAPGPKVNGKKASKGGKGKGFDLASSMVMGMELNEVDEQKRLERERRFQQDHEMRIQQRQEAEESAALNQARYAAQHREALEQTANQAGIYDEVHWANDYPLIVGTCQTLEKPYFRLTTAPDPREVRPLSVLQRAFHMLKLKWVQEPNYSYMCEQLKSIRQDLQVQRLFNAFAVEVYESHARIALEMRDFCEFNQCQSQLGQLYDRGIPGNRFEFISYRILYYLYTKARRDHKSLLKSLTPEELADPRIQFALAARSASLNNNTFQFFELYFMTESDVIKLGYVLLEQIVDRERVKGLHALMKSHQQSVSVRNIAVHLGFCYEHMRDLEAVQAGELAAHLVEDPNVRALKFINRVISRVCLEIPSPPQDPSPYLVPEGPDVESLVRPKATLAQFMESYLLHFTKVDIKGQISTFDGILN